MFSQNLYVRNCDKTFEKDGRGLTGRKNECLTDGTYFYPQIRDNFEEKFIFVGDPTDNSI